ncbi:MAG: uL15 family ribosomal protein [Patescibacteria group bacterium]|nr:uL15 family ribosomal protein [Patescibacteria group bacterium]
MKLHQLSSIKSRRSQRIGRGGKRGTTSGRGTKGQRSRAGRRIRPALRDLVIRLPKRRGFRNKQKAEKPAIFNIGELSQKLKSYAAGKGAVELNRELLQAAGLLGKNFKGKIKILGKGEAAFPMTVKGIAVSKSVEAKLGGK